jgi:hypothetical protein
LVAEEKDTRRRSTFKGPEAPAVQQKDSTWTQLFNISHNPVSWFEAVGGLSEFISAFERPQSGQEALTWFAMARQ